MGLLCFFLFSLRRILGFLLRYLLRCIYSVGSNRDEVKTWERLRMERHLPLPELDRRLSLSPSLSDCDRRR